MIIMSGSHLSENCIYYSFFLEDFLELWGRDGVVYTVK